MNTVFLTKIRKWFLNIIIFIGIILIFQWYQTRSIVLDKLSPQKLNSLSEKKVDLWKKGKKNLIFFFAPWCIICKTSMPALDDFIEEETHVVAVAFSYTSKKEIREMTNSLVFSTPILLGNSLLQENIGIDRFPSLLFVDEFGNIRSKIVGFTTSWGMKARLWFMM